MNPPLPIEWFTIRTNLSEEEVYNRVAKVTGDYHLWYPWYRFPYSDSEILEGSVNQDGFVVREIERSFLRKWRTPPWVRGRIYSVDSETRVDIFIHPGFFGIIGFIGFAIFAIIVLMNVVWQTTDRTGPWQPTQVFVMVIFLLFFLWLLIDFRREVGKAKRYFQTLLRDETPLDA